MAGTRRERNSTEVSKWRASFAPFRTQFVRLRAPAFSSLSLRWGITRDRRFFLFSSYPYQTCRLVFTSFSESGVWPGGLWESPASYAAARERRLAKLPLISVPCQQTLLVLRKFQVCQISINHTMFPPLSLSSLSSLSSSPDHILKLLDVLECVLTQLPPPVTFALSHMPPGIMGTFYIHLLLHGNLPL